jgi:hypothetical protein
MPFWASFLDKNRLELLKHSTEHEIEFLLQSVSLATLHEW